MAKQKWKQIPSSLMSEHLWCVCVTHKDIVCLLCMFSEHYFVPAQDHRTAAAFPWNLWEPCEDSAPCAWLVETSVCPEGRKAKNGMLIWQHLPCFMSLNSLVTHNHFTLKASCHFTPLSWLYHCCSAVRTNKHEPSPSAQLYLYIIKGNLSP